MIKPIHYSLHSESKEIKNRTTSKKILRTHALKCIHILCILIYYIKLYKYDIDTIIPILILILVQNIYYPDNLTKPSNVENGY